jgi:hypothetical protein
MNAEPASFVCGFGDLSEGIGGLAWDLAEPGAALLRDGRVQPATFALEEGGDAATLALTADGASVDATLAPIAAEIALGGGPVTSICSAEARFAGGARSVRCIGQICRWASNPLERAATFRQMVVEAGPAVLIAVAGGEPGAEGHGEEKAGGWRIQGEDASPFEETLISTQYDGSGDPTRIGLELWAADADQTSRAAATRVSGSLLGGARSAGAWAGFFRCHTDGTEGIGTYLLWRE